MNKVALIAAVILLSSLPAFAQDFQVGARAKAMGGSYTAFEDDPVSVWLNPAGIARQASMFTVQYQTFTQYELDREQAFIGTTGRPEAGLTDPPVVPSFAGFIMPLEGGAKHALAFALIRPFENRLTYDFPAPPAIAAQTEQQFWRFRAAYAYDFKLGDEATLFSHLSVGAGVDVAYTRYEFTSFSSSGIVIDGINDTNAQPGYGAGLLTTVYDNRSSFRMDLGVAYQSKIDFDMQFDEATFASWDWPSMVNGGVTFYLFEEVVRLTFDAQRIAWSDAVSESTDPASPSVEDTLNLSAGVEVVVGVSDSVVLMPRIGFRRYDAPWSDPDNLPSIALTLLSIETDDDEFNIVTFGLGIRWDAGGGRNRSIDIGVEIGGEVNNYSIGYTHYY